ncbi:MAG: hypothetical protein RL329_1154 [Bacteroidota bacterium]|jgi:hypothetical protein
MLFVFQILNQLKKNKYLMSLCHTCSSFVIKIVTFFDDILAMKCKIRQYVNSSFKGLTKKRSFLTKLKQNDCFYHKIICALYHKIGSN